MVTVFKCYKIQIWRYITKMNWIEIVTTSLCTLSRSTFTLISAILRSKAALTQYKYFHFNVYISCLFIIHVIVNNKLVFNFKYPNFNTVGIFNLITYACNTRLNKWQHFVKSQLDLNFYLLKTSNDLFKNINALLLTKSVPYSGSSLNDLETCHYSSSYKILSIFKIYIFFWIFGIKICREQYATREANRWLPAQHDNYEIADIKAPANSLHQLYTR